MKQATILVTEKEESMKRDYAESGLCFIRDWNLGFFEVPISMKKAFEERFNTTLSIGAESSTCPLEITEVEINNINRNNWPMVFWSQTTTTYVVCISDSYLRDTQVFKPEKTFNTEDEREMTALTDDDDNWHDFSGSAFLGVYKWNEKTLDNLRKYVASLHGLHPETLEIISVN